MKEKSNRYLTYDLKKKCICTINHAKKWQPQNQGYRDIVRGIFLSNNNDSTGTNNDEDNDNDNRNIHNSIINKNKNT